MSQYELRFVIEADDRKAAQAVFNRLYEEIDDEIHASELTEIPDHGKD